MHNLHFSGTLWSNAYQVQGHKQIKNLLSTKADGKKLLGGAKGLPIIRDKKVGEKTHLASLS